ncbi:MAG: glycosyltransferase, partial [Desulfobacteraceae bacterium]
DKVILLFGAVRSYKGIDSAIDAFARVKKKVSTAKLLIVGKLWEDWEPYASLIKHHEIDKEVATHLNYIPSAEVHRYFVAADLVILPYHHFDSQSGVGGTAIAFRKPMIVTRVGGLPELVIDPKAVVSERDPAALAEAIITTFNDPARLKKMAKDADTVAKRISWDNIVKQTIGIYKRLLEKT